MPAVSSLLSASDAAERLGVSPRRVRDLCASGEIAARQIGGVWVVPRGEAMRLRARINLSPHTRGRPWSQARAWAAMRRLDGDDRVASLLSASARSRLNASIGSADPQRLLAAVRNRAEPVRVAAQRSVVEELRGRVVPSGIDGAGIHGHGLTGASGVDGYLDADGFERLQRDLGVLPDPAGDHLVRVVDDPALLDGLDVAPRLAVAADLLDHAVEDGLLDGRVVSVARTLLAAASPP